jgi:AhpD family alkylhydroperoxidase
MSITSATRDIVIPRTRVAVEKLAPTASRALNALDDAVRKTSIEPGLLDLVRLRVSQINGCAYCVDMHSRDALAAGETERRVFALPVWRETPFFTARQRAALELAEAMTRLAERAAAQFTERELAELIWAITVINAWNRLGATARPWPFA